MKRILFPTDFSPCARNAFDYAIHLAGPLDATIDLVSIYNLPVGEASSVPPEFIQRMLNEKRQATLKNLQNFILGFPDEHIGTLRADYGVFVYQEVTDIAEDKEYDLIVMGTKGEHNAMERLMGSVTTHTMMHAPCPVLAIPEDAKFEGLKHIVYASDFLPSEAEALEKLTELVQALDVRLGFVHVDTSGEGAAKLKAWKQSPMAKSFSDAALITNPSPMAGMEEFIKEHEVDMLALFIPQRRLWERLFHTSFSKKMAFHTKVPLLVFRE